VNVLNIHKEDEMAIAAKLDEFGKPAWIAAVILGFVVFWPVGLATLAFLIWSGRMGCSSKRAGFAGFEGMGAFRRGSFGRGWGSNAGPFQRTSGNSAFDEYRNETLKRLEEEEREFQDFLEKLRAAKDKSEFDQFMADRRGRSTQADVQSQD
jgi:hypothetical protein